MDLRLGGKLALVTGGSKGLGLACARRLSAEGATVCIVSRDPANVERARLDLAQNGHIVHGFTGDLGQSDEAERIVAAVEAAHGPIEILVNSAGAARRTPADELDAASWTTALAAKFFPTIHGQDAVLRRMRARATQLGPDGTSTPAEEIGAIVNIIGSGGRFPTSTHLAGGAANAALMLASVGLARHYAPFGIRINAVNPGQIRTERLDHALAVDAQSSGVDVAEITRRAVAAKPLRRFGRPEEIASVVAFLASPQASYVVGAVVMADGGEFAAL